MYRSYSICNLKTSTKPDRRKQMVHSKGKSTKENTLRVEQSRVLGINQHNFDSAQKLSYGDYEQVGERRYKNRRNSDTQENKEKIQKVEEMTRSAFTSAKVLMSTRERSILERIAKLTQRSLEVVLQNCSQETQSFKTTIKCHTWKMLYPNPFTRICAWLSYELFEIDPVQIHQRWYHTILPFRISYGLPQPIIKNENIDEYYARINKVSSVYGAYMPIPYEEILIDTTTIYPLDMLHIDIQINVKGVRFEHSVAAKYRVHPIPKVMQ